MNSFFKDFKKYTECVPPGVRLPKIKISKNLYERIGVSKDISNFDFLRKLCHEGVKTRGIDKFPNKEEYYDRAKEELSVLEGLGFVDYILLNWDILNFCHDNSIPTGPGRGSAAGSLVLYLIGVTQVDPVRYELFFERFVSKSRARQIDFKGITYLDGSLLADIDNDISYEKRRLVIEYIEKKYPSSTAKIATLNRLSSKLCIKECVKIVGCQPEQEANLISSLIPKKFGIVASLKDSFLEVDQLKEWSVKNSHILKVALKLEKLNKNTGVHPSGIAISYGSISELCPLQRTKEGALVTCYDMNWVSELMVKFDILGLRTLSVIYDCCDKLGLDVYDIDLFDKNLYSPLQSLKCPHGLFQIEAHTDYRVCREVRPRDLEELSAVVAIARPGALDFLDQYKNYIESGESQLRNNFFSDILGYTGGIPLYQEQLMKIKVGFTLDEAEQIRRIVGKKKVDKIQIWKEKISSKISDNNLDPAIGDFLWRVAEDSANYSFNKSHSICYATLAAWTTYLKFNHPQQFFLSLLKMAYYEPNPQKEIQKISQELLHFDIKLLPPNLFKSEFNFSIEGDSIRYGLKNIKGISSKSLEALSNFRKSKVNNKYDIFILAKQSGINIGVVSALIQAGALSECSGRSKLVLEAQLFNLLTDKEKRNIIDLGPKFEYDLVKCIKDCVDKGLLGDNNKPIISEKRYETLKKYEPYKNIYLMNKRHEKFANWYFENKLLGYSYSSSLDKVFSDPNGGRLNNSLDYDAMERNESGKFICIISDAIKGKSRNNNKYLKLEAFDDYGSFPILFSDNRRENKFSAYEESGAKMPKEDNIVVCSGSKGDDILFANSLKILDEKIYMKLMEIKKV